METGLEGGRRTGHRGGRGSHPLRGPTGRGRREEPPRDAPPPAHAGLRGPARRRLRRCAPCGVRGLRDSPPRSGRGVSRNRSQLLPGVRRSSCARGRQSRVAAVAQRVAPCHRGSTGCLWVRWSVSRTQGPADTGVAGRRCRDGHQATPGTPRLPRHPRAKQAVCNAHLPHPGDLARALPHHPRGTGSVDPSRPTPDILRPLARALVALAIEVERDRLALAATRRSHGRSDEDSHHGGAQCVP